MTTNSARLRPRWDLAWANLKFGVPADLPDFKFFQCRVAEEQPATPTVEPRPPEASAPAAALRQIIRLGLGVGQREAQSRSVGSLSMP